MVLWHWSCCGVGHVSCGTRVLLSGEFPVCAVAKRRTSWTKAVQIPASDKDEAEPRKGEIEKEQQQQKEKQNTGDGDRRAKIQRLKILRPFRSLPRCFRGRRRASSSSSSPDRLSTEGKKGFLKTVFSPFRKRRKPFPRVLTPPAIFVLSPEETEVVVAMDAHARRHRSRRASELYNVESEDDHDFLPEASYPGMYQDRFFGGAFEEGWTTVGEATIVMDRRSPDSCAGRYSSHRSQGNISPTEKSPSNNSTSIKSYTSRSPACRSPTQPLPSSTHPASCSPENLSTPTRSPAKKSPSKHEHRSPSKDKAFSDSDPPFHSTEGHRRNTSGSPKKTDTSWRSPFSSPKKVHESKLARAAVESSPKKSPKHSPRNSPKKVKAIPSSNSPVTQRRVLPEILESSVQQYRPVYHTPPLDNTNLVPKPYSSKYSATSPPFRGPVASPRTLLPKTGVSPYSAETQDDKTAPVSPRIPKDTKGKVKKTLQGHADLPENSGKALTNRRISPTSPTKPASPTIKPNPTSPTRTISHRTSAKERLPESKKSSPNARTQSPDNTVKTRARTQSPDNTVQTRTRSKTPSPIASPSRTSPTSPTNLEPRPSNSRPSRSTASPVSSPFTISESSHALTPPTSPLPSPEADNLSPDSTDLDPEEFLALSTLDSALLDTLQQPSLYNCSNEPFNSYEELQTMTEKPPPRSSCSTPLAVPSSRPSSRTKTSEYSGDIDSSGSRRTSECLDTTLSRDSLNNCDEMKSLRSFVAQEELSLPSSPCKPGSQREESVEFLFEEVKDSPQREQRQSVSPSGGDTAAQGEKKINRVSPKFGKFTQKVSDKNKGSEEKSKSGSFLPMNILSFGTRDKKAKVKSSETDSPQTEGWTSEAIEDYILQTSKEESVRLGLLTEEDVAYHEARAAGRQKAAPRQLPEVMVSNELQAPARVRRRAAPVPPENKSPTWKPQDIENYLLEHNMNENLRLGLLSKEDIDIYEWKRATGMSPICDTSWTRETLRRNKIVYSSDSSVSGSTPASPDPSGTSPRRSSPSLMPPPPRRHAPKAPELQVEKAPEPPSEPVSVPRRRARAPAPPPGTPPVHDSPLPSQATTSETSRTVGHFAFRGFKLGQRVDNRKPTAPEPPAAAGLKQETVKPPAEAHIPEDSKVGGVRALFTRPKVTSPVPPKPTAPTPGITSPGSASSEFKPQDRPKPEVSKGRVPCPGIGKPLSRPKRLPLEKIGVKLPGMTGPPEPPTPPAEDIETVSVESVSPSDSPTQKRKGGTGERAPRKKTPYSMLARFLRKDPTPSPSSPTEVPVHALFLRESPRGTGAAAVADDDEGGVRKKLSDMRLRLGCLRRRGDSQGSVRPMPEEVQGWAESFHNLMASKYGQALFKAFLQREFSEENVEFWLAVEDFKKTRAAKMPSKASKIHSDYVAVQAPKELNLDPGTRAQIAKSLDCPDKYIFDAAQKRVQALMESDAYLRFLQSDLYKELLHPESSLPKPEAL